MLTTLGRRVSVALGLAIIATVAFALPARADVEGFRWGPRKICVHYSGHWPSAADYMVAAWDASADLQVVRRSDCTMYTQRVNVTDGKSGLSKAAGWTSFTGTQVMYWCTDTCTGQGYFWGQDSGGYWSWLLKSPVTIHMNTSYAWTYSSYRSALVHEGGHAMGLAHTTRCDSVMSSTCFGKGYPTAYDRSEVERIYPW